MSPPRFPRRPRHPERVCWGCDRYCPATDMACTKERTLHPCEFFGEDWATDADHERSDDPDASPATEGRGKRLPS